MHWTPTDRIDFSASTARFHRWGVDLANVVEGGRFLRVSNDGVAYAAEQHVDGSIEVCTVDPADEPAAMVDLQWRLGEPLDRQPLYELAQTDPIVADLVARFPGVRPPLHRDPFEALVSAITAQQVNLTWATTTRSRVIEAYGLAHPIDATVVWQFPSPERIAAVNPAELRALQFTTRKSEYIVGVARAATEGQLDGLESLGNEEVIRSLVQLRGIGRWSAEWLLARCLARPDVIAAGDLGVRKAVSGSYRSSDEVLPEDLVRDIAAPWGDATNLVTHLLLETLNT